MKASDMRPSDVTDWANRHVNSAKDKINETDKRKVPSVDAQLISLSVIMAAVMIVDAVERLSADLP